MSAKYVVDVAEYFCLGIYLVELLVLDYLIFASAPVSEFSYFFPAENKISSHHYFANQVGKGEPPESFWGNKQDWIEW